jgi:hypothetical protein
MYVIFLRQQAQSLLQLLAAEVVGEGSREDAGRAVL